MYPLSFQALKPAWRRSSHEVRTRIASNVVYLGLTSLLTDISSEMVTSVLPLYLMFQLQLSPAALGVVDGLHQGGASLVKLVGGFVTDRTRRHKHVAAAGYGLSALCKLGLLLLGKTAFALGILTLIDRLGKGMRTAPRDAILSLSVNREQLGAAFGVHRTLDTAGAMLGPLVAFGILRLVPEAYDVIFVVSFLLGLVGLAVLLSFVRNPEVRRSASSRRIGPREVLGLLVDRRLKALLIVAAVCGLATVSDPLLYLVLQRRLQFDADLVPLLYVATPSVYMLLALPVGRLADRVGRIRIVLLGYGLLPAVYAVAAAPLPGVVALPLTVVLLGAHYAATDGVLMAVASSCLPDALRASGLSVVSTAHQLGRLLASMTFGLLWARLSAPLALACFGGFACVWLATLARPLSRSLTEVPNE